MTASADNENFVGLDDRHAEHLTGICADGIWAQPDATPAPTAAPKPSDKLPKNVSRLPNGNLRYDDGLIAFEAPDNATIFVSPTNNAKGTVYPENTTILSIRVLMPVPVDSPYNNDFVLTETQQKVFNSVTTGIAQLPPDVDAAEFVWTKEYAGSKNTGYTMFAGRAAICHTNTYKTKTTYVSIPLSGNRIFELVYSDYPPDAGNKMALDMFLNTLEIRDSLYAEPPAGSVQTASPALTLAPTVTPAPTAAPDLSAWTGYWMTYEEDMAEMIITDNGNGTLHAKALFLPAGDHEATLTPQADGSMRFESQYGHLIGSMIRQADGGLRLTFTGGTTMEDEEATEYQGYFAQGFIYYPAVYADMWYQTPEDAAATPDDWLGDWTAMNGDGVSALQISRMNGQLMVDVTLGRYHFSGPADMGSDTIISVYADDFYCMLILNKKLNRIAMMETDSSIEEVYDITGNPYYGILIFRKASDNSFSATPDQIDAISDIELPETLIVSVPSQAPHTIALIPVPDKAGYMQVPVSRVDATSWIVGKDPDAYAPFRMIDGEETTAFQFSTKTTPLGEAYLYFDFDGPVTLDELWMKNGFWKITDGKDQYTRNSRAKKMTIEVQYAGENGYRSLRTVSLKDDKTRKDWKVIDMLGVENVTGVRIRIDEIFRGSKYSTDVCISEIMFVRHAEQ